MSTQRGARPVSAPVFSQAALAEAGIPMAPFDQPQTSTPIKVIKKEERRLEVTVEAVEPSKIEAAADKVFKRKDELRKEQMLYFKFPPACTKRVRVFTTQIKCFALVAGSSQCGFFTVEPYLELQ